MNAVGQWRATYTPGDWIVLSGPTSLVLLEPPTDDWSPLVSALWEGVVGSASMTDLASVLAAFRFDAMPNLAAFFWTDDGMRSLVRGSVSIVDLGDGSVLATGDGVQTWNEVGLGDVTQVRVDTAQPINGGLALPLVVGAVRASSVVLDASDGARITSPQSVTVGESDDLATVDGPAPVDDAEEAGAATQLEDAPTEEELPAEPPLHDPQLHDPPVDEEPIQDPAPDEPAEDWPAEDGPAYDGQATEAMPPPFADGLFAADPDLDELENGDTQLWMAPVPPAPPIPPLPPAPVGAASAGVSPDSMIMAVVCQYGHASSQNATSCRICGSPIAPQGPQLVPRPVLAVLRGSDGTTTAVDRAVLVGRAPSGERSNARAPRLMTVPSPGHDISRSHAEVAPDDWEIVVTDLHSTNGTVIVGPGGRERVELPPGQPTAVALGSVMELGDGVSVLIDFPQ